jgi:catechol 2,3-dioxygenase-like lactoylglutathione lyase family enzyme
LDQSIHAGDLDASVAFYRDGLGLVEMQRLDLGNAIEVILGFGDAQSPFVLLLADKGAGDAAPVLPRPLAKLVLATSDAEKLHARLDSAGHAPTAIHLHAASGTRVFFVTDPDGNRIEITQRAAPPVREGN